MIKIFKIIFFHFHLLVLEPHLSVPWSKHVRRRYLSIVDTGRCEATSEGGWQLFFCSYWLFQPYCVNAIHPVPTAINCLAYLLTPWFERSNFCFNLQFVWLWIWLLPLDNYIKSKCHLCSINQMLTVLFAMCVVHSFAMYIVHSFVMYVVHSFVMYIVHIFAIFIVYINAKYIVYINAKFIVHIHCKYIFLTKYIFIPSTSLCQVYFYSKYIFIPITFSFQVHLSYQVHIHTKYISIPIISPYQVHLYAKYIFMPSTSLCQVHLYSK